MPNKKINKIDNKMSVIIFAYLNSERLILNANINEPNKNIKPKYSINAHINKLKPLNWLKIYFGLGALCDNIKLLAVRPKNKYNTMVNARFDIDTAPIAKPVKNNDK